MPADLLGLLDREGALLADRLRRVGPGWYAAAAWPFPNRAAAVHHLAATLAVTAQGLEAADAVAEPRWRPFPRVPTTVLADALAVAVGDVLAAAAGSAAPLTGRSVWRPGGRVPAETTFAASVAELLLHRSDLDGAPPPRRLAAAALAVLEPGQPAERFVPLARSRCPAYGGG